MNGQDFLDHHLLKSAASTQKMRNNAAEWFVGLSATRRKSKLETSRFSYLSKNYLQIEFF